MPKNKRSVSDLEEEKTLSQKRRNNKEFSGIKQKKPK